MVVDFFACRSVEYEMRVQCAPTSTPCRSRTVATIRFDRHDPRDVVLPCAAGNAALAALVQVALRAEILWRIIGWRLWGGH
ncbi:hypothetical protein [Nocardia sp. CA-120079]|uniref:hypothetical protein n=1 Tax=Nocardia sp. CA-120079 TaxID=3239974 RepID=UPI003D97F8AC